MSHTWNQSSHKVALFIMSYVFSSVCIIKPFQVYRPPFLQDASLCIAVTLVLAILYNEKI